MNDEEREIDLRLMFAYVFKQWRKILLVTLVCGLLGVGYKLIKVLPTYSSLRDTYNQNMEAYEASTKTVEEQKNKTQAIIDQLTEYSQESIKANIDPYSEAQTTASISIVTAKGQDDFEALLSGTNHANQITQAYALYINREISYTKITDKLGLDEQLLKELISVGTNYDTDTITVTVIGSSEDTTKEIMDYILSQVSGNENKIHLEYGDYTAVESTASTYTVTDAGLLTPISAQMLSPNLTMNDTLTKINTLKTSLTTISTSTVAKPVPVNTTIEKNLIKYLILGFAVGCLCSITICAILFALSGKVYSEEDVKLIVGSKILAVVPAKINEKHNTKFDKYLNKKIDSAYDSSNDVALKKATVNMESYKGKKLILINSKTNQDIEELKNNLHSINKEINLNVSTDINKNASELIKLKDSDGVILLIERNKTKIADLSSIVETINFWQKPIIGCIVL